MLKFKFALHPDAISTLHTLENDVSISSVILTLQNEEIKNLCEPLSSTGILSYNLYLLRLSLKRYDCKAAYIVTHLPKGSFCVITYVSQGIDSRESMKYLFGYSNLCGALSHEYFTLRVDDISELKVKLFENLTNKASRDDLMTESERLNKQVLMMEPPPKVTTLPGTLVPLSDSARDSIKKYNDGTIHTVTLMIADDEITVDCIREDEVKNLYEIDNMLPATSPRYVLTHYRPAKCETSKNIMIHICPSPSSLKERMIYASAKAAFLTSVAECGSTFVLKKEATNCDELVSTIEYAFNDNKQEDDSM